MDPIAELASPEFPALSARAASAFEQFVLGLDEAGWQRPIPSCPPWRVRELVAHCTWVAEMYGGSIQRSLTGAPAAPLWEDVPAVRRDRHEGRANWPTDQLLDAYRQRVGELQATLERLTPADYTTPAWHPAGIWSIGRLEVAWFWEIGIHGLDLRSAFDPNASLEPDLVPTYVDYLTRALPRYLNPSADPDLVATYRFHLTDLGRSLGVRLVSGASEVLPSYSSEADVACSLDGATFVLAVLQRRPFDAAVEAGRARVDGDAALARRFWQQLKRI